jgi:transposase
MPGERRLHADLALRMLAAGSFPCRCAICDFRAFHPSEQSELFVQEVKLAREMSLVNLGTVAIDGTKGQANASRRSDRARLHRTSNTAASTSPAIHSVSTSSRMNGRQPARAS